MKLSVLIPTWKNLDCLEVLWRGLKRNSALDHQIIIFFNEFDDRCARWLQGRNTLYDSSSSNLGVCEATNRAAKLATGDFLCYMNDDMYPLPGWDTALFSLAGMSDKIWLSGTAIEPGDSTPCYIGNRDYGRSPDDFQEEKLLKEYRSLLRPYNVVSTWTPVMMPRRNWEEIGGFDEEYFPGFGSDPDLAMKMYDYGCRLFIGVGSSLVYHFARSTTGRFEGGMGTDPRTYFKSKWGFSRKKFHNKIIRRDSVITPGLLSKLAKN